MSFLSRFSIASLARGTALVLLLALGVLTVSFLISRENMLEAEREWGVFQSQAMRKVELANQLRVEIGFGGLIHHFKNYLLRKEDGYKEEVFRRAEAVRILIDEYRKLEPNAVESQALDLILDMVNQNEGSMAVAASLFETGIPLEAIDAQVQFDEVPATWAMDALTEQALLEREAGEERLVAQLKQGIGRTTLLGISVVVAFAIGIALFLWVMRVSIGRLQRTTAALNTLARGEEDVKILYADEANEIGDLARAAVAFQASLRRIKESSEQLAASNEELNATNEELNATVEALEATMEKAIQAEKHASLGQLVTGVAHEINTPLGVAITSNSVIHTGIQHVLTQMDNERPSRKDVQRILQDMQEAGGMLERNLSRVADLVQSFRQVAADQHSEEPREVNLAEFLPLVARSLEAQINRDSIELFCNPPAEQPFRTLPGAVSQVLTQLTLNSLAHAFGEQSSGRIEIEARIDDTGQLELVYQDNGCGIPAEAISRIFDPFFTTSRGQGRAGLGLHVVFNLVTGALGGTIEAEEPPGGGVCFRIHIPQLGARAPAA